MVYHILEWKTMSGVTGTMLFDENGIPVNTKNLKLYDEMNFKLWMGISADHPIYTSLKFYSKFNPNSGFVLVKEFTRA